MKKRLSTLANFVTVLSLGLAPFRIKMAVATLAYSFFIRGLSRISIPERRSIQKHRLYMKTGIGLDLGLVLYLQFTKSAIQTVLNQGQASQHALTMVQNLHILTSTLATALYIPVLVLGTKLSLSPHGKHRDVTLRRHRMMGVAALLLRTAGFLLMFSMWERHS